MASIFDRLSTNRAARKFLGWLRSNRQPTKTELVIIEHVHDAVKDQLRSYVQPDQTSEQTRTHLAVRKHSIHEAAHVVLAVCFDIEIVKISSTLDDPGVHFRSLPADSRLVAAFSLAGLAAEQEIGSFNSSPESYSAATPDDAQSDVRRALTAIKAVYDGLGGDRSEQPDFDVVECVIVSMRHVFRNAFVAGAVKEIADRLSQGFHEMSPADALQIVRRNASINLESLPDACARVMRECQQRVEFGVITDATLDGPGKSHDEEIAAWRRRSDQELGALYQRLGLPNPSANPGVPNDGSANPGVDGGAANPETNSTTCLRNELRRLMAAGTGRYRAIEMALAACPGGNRTVAERLAEEFLASNRQAAEVEYKRLIAEQATNRLSRRAPGATKAQQAGRPAVARTDTVAGSTDLDSFFEGVSRGNWSAKAASR